jgi:hypothetical protein
MPANLKKFRTIAIALAITFSTNYAISFAARGGVTTIPTDAPRPTLVESRGGVTTIPTDAPRPVNTRGGVTTIPTDAPRPVNN